MRPYTRRKTLLAAAALTPTVGCLGGGSGGSGGGSGGSGGGSGGSGGDSDGGGGGSGGSSGGSDDTATPAPSTTEPPATETATPTATPEPTPTAAEESAAVCSPWGGEPTAYDAAGTPFFVGYDYVASWTPGEIDERPGGGHFVRFTSPTVGDDDSRFVIRVSQGETPYTAAERDEEVQFFLNLESEPRVVVDEITYDGETVRVLGVEDSGPYQTGYVVFLPYGSGSDRRYYGISVVTFSGGGRAPESEAEFDTCMDILATAQQTIIQSLRPNPDTTFEGG